MLCASIEHTMLVIHTLFWMGLETHDLKRFDTLRKDEPVRTM